MLMQNKISLFTQNKVYFGGLLLTILFGILLLLLNGKAAAFIALNSYHPFYLNVFFINYTFIGDGLFALCLIAIYFFYLKKKQQGFALLYSFLISGLAAQILKNLVNSPRPKLYFEAGTYLNFIEGVTLSGRSGFPSGHTATAFAIATVLVLMMKNKNWQFLILSAALLVGYSRIYLAQHFLLDVIVGALLGCLSGILAFYIAQNRISIKKILRKLHRVPNKSASSASTIQTA